MVLYLVQLGACARTEPEKQLRETIAAMEVALEARQPGEFVEHVGKDFVGNNGQFDRTQLGAILRAVVLRNQSVAIALGPLDVTLYGEDRATVKVTAVATGGSGGLLPERGQGFDIESGWRYEDGEWVCYNATWKEQL